MLKIDHIQLAIPRGGEDEARRFWMGVIGMDEVAKPETLAGRGGCWFERDGTAVHVGVEADFRPQKKGHPAFSVTDLAALAETLKRNNFTVIWDDALVGRDRFYTADPFGNRIEFLEAA